MTDFLTGADLASYLGDPTSGALDNIAARTNSLVTEAYLNPTDPAPAWVVNIAYDVAIRAGSNPKGLTSQTRAWDDITRTERWEAAARVGVYLTDEEYELLQGEAATEGSSTVQSIRMTVPGWTPQCPY